MTASGKPREGDRPSLSSFLDTLRTTLLGPRRDTQRDYLLVG